MPIKLDLSPDRTQLALKGGGDLSALEIDNLIRDLAAVRAAMTPIHPAEPPDDPRRQHRTDNLLWVVRPASNRTAIEFAMQHPGLGWSVMALSRAQAEDLQTSIDVALARIPEAR